MNRYSASAAKRWMTCAASAVWEHKLPPSGSSVYAEEGSAAHAVAEMGLIFGCPASDFIGQVVYVGREDQKQWECTEEMAEAVQVYLDFCGGAEMEHTMIEHKFQAGEHFAWLRGAIADFMTFDGRKLIIVDYKHGVGVAVSARDNHQMLTYALLACEHFGVVKEIEMHIIQPRTASGEPHSSWTCGIDRIERHKMEQQTQLTVIADAESHDDLLTGGLGFHVSGDHCQWCPAIKTCPKLLNDTKVMAPDLMSQGIDHLSQDQIGWVLDNGATIVKFIDGVKSEAMLQLERGLAIPGYKLVNRKSHRRWSVDEAKVLRTLRPLGLVKKDLYVAEIKSPSQVEKMLKKGCCDGIVESVVIGHAVAPESDKRKETNPNKETETLVLEMLSE